MTVTDCADRCGLAVLLLLATSGCSNLGKTGPQSIEGLAPVGSVNMTEIIAAAADAGQDTLN
jgi:uncharacterized metal-binding protein